MHYRMAIITDALTVYGGAERVLDQILDLYPHARLFSLVNFSEPTQSELIKSRATGTTFIQTLPFARRHFRKYLQFWPIAIEQIDLSEFDVVISSHYAVANGCITGPQQLHLSYTHSPMRYIWDLQHQYLAETGMGRGLMGIYVRSVLHQLRKWDAGAAQRVEQFAVNSSFVARRVRKYYNRDSQVIHPPVDVKHFQLQHKKDDYYIAVSRLVPYKRTDLIVKAFNAMPDRRLVVIGDGPDLATLRRIARPNVSILGYQSNEEVRDKLAKARAFLFAGVEDFGITPLEAQACGTPVIGLGSGGLLETVQGLESDNPTGVFFQRQTSEAIIEAVEQFERLRGDFDPNQCRANALRFDVPVFRERFADFVGRAISKFNGQPTSGRDALVASPAAPLDVARAPAAAAASLATPSQDSHWPAQGAASVAS